MTPAVFVVDTNVIVSAMIGSDPKSPPAQVLEAMLDGSLLYLMSSDLLTEYASVLRRPRLVRLHRRTDAEIDQLLAELTANAIWCEPVIGETAPDPGDNHLWALLGNRAQSHLITGDRLLVENAPEAARVLTPRDFVSHRSTP